MNIPFELGQAISTDNGLTAVAQIVTQSIQIDLDETGLCLITVTRGAEMPIRFRLDDARRRTLVALLTEGGRA